VTGESLPVEKRPGDEVFAGTINGRGALDVRVTRFRRDTTLARIIHLVERAQAQRAPAQALVERFARVYTPAVMILAAVVAIVPPLMFHFSWHESIYRGLVLLVVSCPCALVISTPVSIVAALAGAARQGVLIKGGMNLERTSGVQCVAFDKTGTLTRGVLEVVSVVPLNGKASVRSWPWRRLSSSGRIIPSRSRSSGTRRPPASRPRQPKACRCWPDAARRAWSAAHACCSATIACSRSAGFVRRRFTSGSTS
jgi:cation transport ATPase